MSPKAKTNNSLQAFGNIHHDPGEFSKIMNAMSCSLERKNVVPFAAKRRAIPLNEFAQFA